MVKYMLKMFEQNYNRRLLIHDFCDDCDDDDDIDDNDDWYDNDCYNEIDEFRRHYFIGNDIKLHKEE